MTRAITPSDSLRIERSEPRVSAPGAGERFRAALARGGDQILSSVGGAAGVLPGGSVLSAAVAGLGTETASAAGPTSGNLGTASLVQEQQNNALELLALQQRVSGEQQHFMTVSNVLKSRHETNKSITQNFR